MAKGMVGQKLCELIAERLERIVALPIVIADDVWQQCVYQDGCDKKLELAEFLQLIYFNLAVNVRSETLVRGFIVNIDNNDKCVVAKIVKRSRIHLTIKM